MQYIERHTESLDWITLFLVGCLILYTVVRVAYPKRFQDFIMLPLNNKYFLVHGKEVNIKHMFNLLLFVAQVISVSLFIFLLLKVGGSELITTNPWIFAQICTAYTFFILFKITIEKIVGALFNIESLIDSYIYQKLNFRNLLAILVFIGNLAFFYIVEPTMISLLVFSVVIIVLNCFAIFYSYKSIGNTILNNFFYFILYLCALEISPLVLIYKSVI